MPSTGWPWCLRRSIRCFSPTRRCDSTSTSSLKVGAAKPWPQTSWCRVSTSSTRRYSGASGPSVSSRRASVASVSHSRATWDRACSKTSNWSSAMVQPAAIAWPPKRSSTSGWRLATRSSASRRWKPGIERPEPLSSCSLPGAALAANTKLGRCSLSFSRLATMPTTPSWKSASNTHSAGGGSSLASNRPSAMAKACSRMPPSMSRRSRLMLSSWCARASARAASSVSRHSMPSVMSLRRPAALMRGPSAKPKSKVVTAWAWRPAARNKAAMPTGSTPARTRFRPWATRRRLLASSFTTSATVPSATSGSRLSSLGWASALKAPRRRNSARSASST